ncbi:MAG: hypothetical protein HW390_2750 [Candidatus Brocadiaceae bacterium]|nr:hypothetical protein [Candidatus Brocadiaceae bacterium]
MSMLAAVPTGLKIPASVPIDTSVDYFHLFLRNKMQIYNNPEMHPAISDFL